MTSDERAFRDMKKAVCLLLDHAVYDTERSDECIEAVEFARAMLRRFPNDETIAAMNEARSDDGGLTQEDYEAIYGWGGQDA